MVNPSPRGFLKPKHPKVEVPEQSADPYADLYGYVTPPETTGFQGFMDQLKYINRTSPGAFMQLGAGLMAGDPAGGISNAAQALEQGGLLQRRAQEKLLGRQEEQQNKNLTRQWLLGQGFDEATADAAMANPEILQQLLAAPKGTDDITEYNLAKQQGFQGSFVDFKLAQIKAGVAPGVGTIPPGWRLVTSPDGTTQTMEPIAGGPADPTRKDVVKAGQKDVATETVVSAAQKAREAAASRPAGPYFQQTIADWFQTSDAAETQRQVDVLKAQASSESITAMRAASPSGAGLGSPSDKDMAILAAKAGALDPSSANFKTALDDYEKTLLKTIHGPEEGERIFQSTRKVEGGLPVVHSQEEADALPVGARFMEPGDPTVYIKKAP